mgnify:CR=1 FL=1
MDHGSISVMLAFYRDYKLSIELQVLHMSHIQIISEFFIVWVREI